MIGRIVDIAQDRRHLSLERGFLVVSSTGSEVGRVALDDLAAVIVSGHGATHSSNLLVALAERCVPFVLCAANHHPVGIIWATEGNYRQSGRIDAQIAASRPAQKRLWQQVVRAKLQMQGQALDVLGVPAAPLFRLAERVRSGDPDNLEAQGARIYWSLLFGSEFRRDRAASGTNALLNYGYAVLRAATARSIMAAGLHPGMGLHHRNALNPMRLVDDLMEPFRPFVDLKVYALTKIGATDVGPSEKKALADVMYFDLPTEYGTTPLMSCLHRMTLSLVRVFEREGQQLEFPLEVEPLRLQSLARA